MNQRFRHGMHVRSIEAGSPKGVIFYVHGLGESGLCLEGIMGHPLLREYSHLAPDMPGYGKSPWLEVPPGISELADLLAGWLSSLGLPKVILLGHSMGGVIGTLLCERFPETVRSFINVEGNVSHEDCLFSSDIGACTLEDFLVKDFDAFRDTIYEKGLSERALRFYHASLLMCDPRAIHRNSMELVRLSQREDLADRLGSLPLPSCYFRGNPRGTQGYSLGLLKRASVPIVEISDSGHWPFIDQPDEFAGKLFEVLSGLSD